MAVDLFGTSGAEAQSAPKGVDLFGGEASSGVDLFGGQPAETSRLTDALDTAKQFTAGTVRTGLEMAGMTVQPKDVPKHPVDLFSIGAAALPVATERYFLEHPDNLAAAASTEAQTRIKQLANDQRAIDQVAQGLVAGDQTVSSKILGGAIQSLPGTMVSLLPAAAGAPIAPAAAFGLASNWLMEKASDFSERRQLGQTPTEADLGSMGHALVATGLEAVPGMAALKYLNNPGAQSGLKTLAKVGAGEALQEGTTQLYDEVARTYAGIQNDPWETSASRIAYAAGSGAAMGPMLAPFGAAINYARLDKTGKIQDKALAGIILESMGETDIPGAKEEALAIAKKLREQTIGTPLDQMLGGLQDNDPFTLKPVGEDLTPESQKQAESLKTRLERRIDAPETEEGLSLAKDLAVRQSQLERSPDAGAPSLEVQTNRATRLEDGLDVTPYQQKVVMSSTDDRIVGLEVGQLPAVPKGAVVAIGSRDMDSEYYFPQDLANTTTEALKTLIDKYAPNMSIVLDLQPLSDFTRGMGAHTAIVQKGGNVLHVITPRDLPSYKMEYQGGNSTSRMEYLGVLAHEFGHALKQYSFIDGMVEKGADTGFVKQIMDDVRQGNLTPESLLTLQQTAPTEAALLAHWKALREQVLSGDMPASQFVKEWIGARKLAWGMDRQQGPRKSIYAWAEEKLGKNLTDVPALELVKAYGDPESLLSFEEFMAEQTSRAVAEKGDFAKTGFGTLFGGIVQKLQKLFVDLKKEGVIPAGTVFQQWLDEQTAFAAKQKKTKGRFTVRGKLKAAIEALPAEDEVNEAASLGIPEPTLDDQAANLSQEDYYMSVVEQLVASQTLEEGEKDYRRLIHYINRGQFEQAQRIIDELGFGDFDRESESGLNPDKTYTTRLMQRLPKGDYVSAMNLAQLANSKTLRKHDVEVAKELAEKYKNGEVSVEELYGALMARNVPLEVEVAQGITMAGQTAFNSYGVENLGALPEDSYTLIFKAPFRTYSKNHFNDPNYVFHARVTVQGNRITVLELQSDMFQNIKATPTDEEIRRLRADVIDDTAAIARIEHWIAEAKAFDKLGSDPIIAMKERALQERKLRLIESQIAYDIAQQRKQFGMLPEETRVWEAMLKDDWWQRAIKEVNAWAVGRVGLNTGEEPLPIFAVRVATGDTMAKVEGWPHDWHIDPKLLENEGVYNATGRITLGVSTREPMAEYMAGDYLSYVPVSPEILAGHTPTYGSMQGIYKRYQTTIPKWLSQKYDAQLFEDQLGNTYWEYQLPKFSEMVTVWDEENPTTRGAATANNALRSLMPRTLAKGNYYAAKLVDNLIQLQQRAFVPLADGSHDEPMQRMVHYIRKAMAFKNTLMVGGEDFVKEFEKLDRQTQEDVQKLLMEEWKSGVLSVELQPLVGRRTIDGRQLNPQAIPLDTSQSGWKNSVGGWAYVPNAMTAKLVESLGLDPQSDRAKQAVTLMLEYKNLVLDHFVALERVMQERIEQKYANTPLVVQSEFQKLDAVMSKLRGTPFVPQVRFGNFIVTVMKDQGSQGVGKRRFKVVRKEHFEDWGEYQSALKDWASKAKKDATLRVSGKELENVMGIPLQLPKGLLENVKNTGDFTEDQIDTLEELMQPTGYNRIQQRYDGLNGELAGASENFIRNFSHFVWHDANYIWKTKFKTDFQKVVNAQNAVLKNTWKRKNWATPELQIEVARQLERNLKIMEKSRDYMLYPPAEFQTARLITTMAYLAFVPKTAILNVSTMLNTYAAITGEYGETEGHKQFAKGLFDTTRLFKLQMDLKNGKALNQHDNELLNVYNTALAEGIIDQSYAYFLAGMANTQAFQHTIRGWKIGHYGRQALDMGMWMFRAIEKANRLSTLITFYNAERARGNAMQAAYQKAVERVDLLQNSYDAGNKPELLRGKKSIMMMFASYSQFMGWVMTGRYEKGMRAQMREEGRAPGKYSWLHGPTMKLWLIYLILGGLYGLPFAENLMDVLKFFWRKATSQNLELELRKFIKEVGFSPDTILHGAMHDVGSMDLSRSFGLGHMLPGTELINREAQSTNEFLGQGLVKAAGPFGGFMDDLMKGTAAGWKAMDGQGRWIEVTKNMPGAIGNVSKAWDASQLQAQHPGHGVMAKDGKSLTIDSATGKPRDLTGWEIVAMGLGANPSILAGNREQNFAMVGEKIYWQTKRSGLLDARWQAVQQRDMEALKKVDTEIAGFNKSLEGPYRVFSITGKVKADSLQKHRKLVAKEEAGSAVGRTGRVIASEVGKAYSEQ